MVGVVLQIVALLIIDTNSLVRESSSSRSVGDVSSSKSSIISSASSSTFSTVSAAMPNQQIILDFTTFLIGKI
jgi:hypothetical protein